MRKSFLGLLFVILATACLGACDDDDDHRGWGHGDQSILFGIRQTTDQASGKVSVTPSYEFLQMDGKGWTQVRYADDQPCFFEDTSSRLGKSHFEGGFARFQGGQLPDDGVSIQANQDGATYDFPGFATGDTMRFNVIGFAMPPVGEIRIAVPAAKLEIVTPKDEPLTLEDGADFDFEWGAIDPKDVGRSSVLVSFETEAAGDHGRDVACFFKEGTRGKVPGALLSKLAAGQTGEVKGTLDVATHTQSTVRARGGWTVYVIATALHRNQPFTWRAKARTN